MEKLTSLSDALQWLNNCVGRKNYVTFISLMGFSLVWVSFEGNYVLSDPKLSCKLIYIYLFPQLTVEAGVGIGVLVRCFTNRHQMEAEIVDRLGNGFSRAPFAAVVVMPSYITYMNQLMHDYNVEFVSSLCVFRCAGYMYGSILAGLCTLGGTFLLPHDPHKKGRFSPLGSLIFHSLLFLISVISNNYSFTQYFSF